MTLRLRNTLLILFAAISAAALVFVVREIFSGETLFLSGIQQYLPALFICLFSSISCIIIFFSFRNTASSEIFFFYIFIFSMIFDIFRFSAFTIKAFPLFEAYNMVPTRFVYYGVFTGTLALFSSGLFTTGLEYQRMEIATVIILTLPAALVLVLPVDVTSMIPGGTWEIGRFHEITAAVGILQVLAIFNFIIAGIKNESREYPVIALALFITISGRAMIFYFDKMIIVFIGFLLLISGTILFARRTHKLYLWD